MKINLGYCCINMTLQKEHKVTIGRGMIKKTFAERGINYASELALANVKDMVEIIKWNHKNGISLYRMSSDMFPWCSEYELKDLPDYDKICNILKGAGTLANQYGQRLTFHPGPFSVLASANPDVVTKTIRDLNTHGEIMDLIGLPRTPYAAINIHVNTTAPDKESAMQRFCQNFQLLNEFWKLNRMGFPLLSGLSRKRFIGDALAGIPAQERAVGSVMGHMLSIQQGASIVRVHDVKATKDAINVWSRMLFSSL